MLFGWNIERDKQAASGGRRRRDDEAKTVVMYGVAVLLGCETFVGKTGEYCAGGQLAAYLEGLVATELGSCMMVELLEAGAHMKQDGVGRISGRARVLDLLG